MWSCFSTYQDIFNTRYAIIEFMSYIKSVWIYLIFLHRSLCSECLDYINVSRKCRYYPTLAQKCCSFSICIASPIFHVPATTHRHKGLRQAVIFMAWVLWYIFLLFALGFIWLSAKSSSYWPMSGNTLAYIIVGGCEYFGVTSRFRRARPRNDLSYQISKRFHLLFVCKLDKYQIKTNIV